MEKIETKEPVYEYKIKTYKKKYVFKTEDGKEFTTEKKALEHEEELKYLEKVNLIEKKTFQQFEAIEMLNYTWYYIPSEEEKEFISGYIFEKRYCNNYLNGFSISSPNKLADQLEVGDWVVCIYEDGGDYHSTNSCYTLEFIKNEMETFLNFFK